MTRIVIATRRPYSPPMTPPPTKPPSPAAFLANAARALGSAGAIASHMLQKPVAPPLPGVRDVVLRQAAQALGDVARACLARPDKLVAAHLDLADAHARLARNAWRRLRGEDCDPAPIALPGRGDRRFSDPDWRDNPLLDGLKQSWLVTARWADELVADADGLDPHTRDKARFYAARIAEALSPTNLAFTNPQVMRSALQTGGASLADGLENLAADIAAADGELAVPYTDQSAYEVGRNLAVTPGKVVFQNDLMQLIQYAPTTEAVAARPLLIVPPWINKFYVLDLTPEKSFVAWAVAQGLTVFVVSWVNPGSRHAGCGFADYMRNGILAALDAIEAATGARETNALGYCIGGTLLAATLAYMAATGDARIRSATLLAAQVDFAEAGELLVFIDEAQVSGLERHMAANGYLEGRKMAQTFSFLRADALIWSPAIERYLMGKLPPLLRPLVLEQRFDPHARRHAVVLPARMLPEQRARRRPHGARRRGHRLEAHNDPNLQSRPARRPHRAAAVGVQARPPPRRRHAARGGRIRPCRGHRQPAGRGQIRLLDQ
jgi:polyhydroxyalkanoate synthase subunit PhaC